MKIFVRHDYDVLKTFDRIHKRDRQTDGRTYMHRHRAQHRAAKTRMVWLLEGEKSLMIRITVSTEYQRVAERQTDRHLATA